MLRFMCRSCLRLWPEHRVSGRAGCPYCGGELAER
jgi:hypothetical protein